MAKVLEKMMDLMNLSYGSDGGYDYDDDDDDDDIQEEPVKKAKSTKVKEEKKKGFWAKNDSSEDQKEDYSKKETQKREAPKREAPKTTIPNTSKGKVEKAPVRLGSNVSVIKGGNNVESVIVSVRPKDDKSKQEIGKYLLEGKIVVINMEGLGYELSQRIIDFTYGVCYAIQGNMKSISKYIVLAVPDEVSLTGIYENAVNEAIQRSKMTYDK